MFHLYFVIRMIKSIAILVLIGGSIQAPCDSGEIVAVAEPLRSSLWRFRQEVDPK